MGIAAALAGCAAYVPEPLSPQQSLDALRARSLSDPALVDWVAARLPPDAPRPPAWTFESLGLAADRLNPELAIARARLASAQAGRISAAERPNPSLSLPIEYTSNPKPGESPWTLGLGLDVPIEAGGKRGARVAQADASAQAARFGLEAGRRQVRSRLRSGLLDLRHARRTLALLQEQETHKSRVTRMLSHRVDLGDTARIELEQAETELLELQRQQAATRDAASQAQAGIAAQVGVPLAAIAASDLHLDSLEGTPPDIPRGQALDDALRQRADVQAALADYEASQGALALAVAGQYPDIHLGPGYTFDAGAHKYALSLSGIELPLFNQHRGPIAEAQARRREAAARFESVMAQGLSAVDQTAAALSSARDQWTLAQRQAELADRVAAAAGRSRDAGATSTLDAMLASLQADAAHLQREDALDRLLRAAAAQEDAVHGGAPAASSELSRGN